MMNLTKEQMTLLDKLTMSADIYFEYGENGTEHSMKLVYAILGIPVGLGKVGNTTYLTTNQEQFIKPKDWTYDEAKEQIEEMYEVCSKHYKELGWMKWESPFESEVL